MESTYIALYTFVISLIYLSGGQNLAESKLERYLKRCNADDYTPLDKTDKLLKRMEKEGYIIRVREREAGGEEMVSFVVGPRGRVEVGERGVAGTVRKVYGKRDVEADELEKKLERSLGAGFIGRQNVNREQEDGQEENGGQEEEEGDGLVETSATRRGPGRPRRRQRAEVVEEEDE